VFCNHFVLAGKRCAERLFLRAGKMLKAGK